MVFFAIFRLSTRKELSRRRVETMPDQTFSMKDANKKINPEQANDKIAAAMTKKEAIKKQLEEMEQATKTSSASAKEHIVAQGETLSHIALHYYGKATPPYYQHIYNHNREVIGDNINIIVPGQKLVIPELPDELK